MKTGEYSKLEKDIDFKKTYLNSTLWWKSILLVPPVCLLFVGLLGILYLFSYDKLVSWYVAPYLLLFILGTIWLKAIRKHLQKAMLAAQGAFRICVAKSVGEQNGYVYTLFVNNEKRHNQHFITRLAESLSADELMANAAAKKKNILLHDEESDTAFYLRAYPIKDLNKKNPLWKDEGCFPVLYINEKYAPVVKGRHVN